MSTKCNPNALANKIIILEERINYYRCSENEYVVKVSLNIYAFAH